MSGGDGNGVSSAQRASPHRDPATVDFREAGRVLECGVPIGQLFGHRQHLAWLAAAVAKMAIGEDEYCKSGRGESLRVGRQTHLPSGSQTVTHHDDGHRCFGRSDR